jgi:hypothetical protein
MQNCSSEKEVEGIEDIDKESYRKIYIQKTKLIPVSEKL